MSREDYQEGFAEGIEYAKSLLLEWADTWEAEYELERLEIMRDKLIEILESPGLPQIA